MAQKMMRSISTNDDVMGRDAETHTIVSGVTADEFPRRPTMTDRSSVTGVTRCIVLMAGICAALASASVAHASIGSVPADGETPDEGYRFVCDDVGRGSSAVDVLRSTGVHGTFLGLFSRYDPEGFEILSDPVLADKTVWAPTDAAFDALDVEVSSLPDADVMAVLGYHITPPRRADDGTYPIITPEFLLDGGQIVHQTRTGILTGSDQRVTTRAEDGVLTVEGATIGPTAWCTQTGSVFSIDTVIPDASATTFAERVIYTLVFRSPLVTLGAIVALVTGGVVLRHRRRARPQHPS